MSKIFVDAMGGDHAPGAVIAGVALTRNVVDAELVLLGNEPVLTSLTRSLKGIRYAIEHCPDTIQMDESPVQAVRSKKNSSIVRGLQLAADTPGSAFFSAGHSGAVFAAALMVMGRIKGVERPAIATVLPTLTGHCILLDAGANVECRPDQLVQFAQMGSLYARIYLKHDKPSVGILSNGEEESKGTELTRAAHALLKADARQLQYVGYVEAKEIFKGAVDVIVTDGFTGNIVLKACESLGKAVSTLLRAELKSTVLSRIGALFCMPGLKRMKRKLDYAEVGSAPLLGVDGNCFIGHGSSSPKAIKNGILRAQEAIRLGLRETLRERFGQK